VTSSSLAPVDSEASDARSGATQSRGMSLLDAPPLRMPSASWMAGVGSAGVHVALVGLAVFLRTSLVREAAVPALVTQLLDVELPPVSQAAPEPEPAQPEAVRAAAPHRVRAAPSLANAPPPAAAAQAAQMLTAGNEVVDFSDKFVSGKSTNYLGGVTAAAGTATQAVRDRNARADGIVAGNDTELNADRSRAPRLAGAALWDCPFPDEADDAAIDHAIVTLRVAVSAEGSMREVDVLRDPGHGFAREARRCAQSKRWEPGLDRAGQPAGSVATVNVRFER
jgi:protein TonB